MRNLPEEFVNREKKDRKMRLHLTGSEISSNIALTSSIALATIYGLIIKEMELTQNIIVYYVLLLLLVVGIGIAYKRFKEAEKLSN